MQNPRDTQKTHTENKLNGTEAQKLKSGNFLDSLVKTDKSLRSKKSEVVGGDELF